MPSTGGTTPLRTADTMREQERSVVTLNPSLAAVVRRMGSQMTDGTSKPLGPTEVIRRACEVLDMVLNIDEDEEFIVRNKNTGDLIRIRYSWEMLNHRG